MPDLAKGMTSHRLADLFDWVKSGELALPELQRPSVWGDSKIPRLLESVYCDYPFGIMLVWTPEPGSQIVCRSFKFEDDLDQVTSRPAKHYLIDGQQRLTSFYRSLHHDAETLRDWMVEVAFNVRDEEFSLIDGKIKSMLANRPDHGWYRLRDLLKRTPEQLEIVRSEQSKVHLGDAKFEAIFGTDGELWRLLPTNVAVGIYNIHERSYGEVTEIFERINEGTPVRESQIVLGKLSALDPGIVGSVENYLAASRVKHGRDFDLDFFITTLSVIARGSVEIAALPRSYSSGDSDEGAASQPEVRADVERTKWAIDRALTFMDRRLKIDTLKYIRAPRTMTCLAYLLDKFDKCGQETLEGHRTAYWVAQSLLIRYHGDQTRFKQDIAAIRRDSAIPPLDEFRRNLRRQAVMGQIADTYKQLDDVDYAISRGDTIFSFVYALLRKNGAVSFPSMRPIEAIRVDDLTEEDPGDLDREFKIRTILHEHHIYPAARLRNELEVSKDDWFDESRVSDIANITFILGDDNFGIGNSAIEYLDAIDEKTKQQHMIGVRRYRTGQYKLFFTDRRKLIKNALIAYFDEFRRNAES
jgi:hypothetical protein